MQFIVRAGALVAAMLCGACATHLAPPYTPDYDSVDRLKAASLAPVAVNPVQPTNPDAKVNKISLRASRLSTANGTFSRYVEEALIRDLKEAGLYSSSAPTRISATLLVNDIDISGLVTGDGTLDLEVVVTRADQTRLRKTYKTVTHFDSNFVGMIAMQNGVAAYPPLVRAALKQIYSDPEFINAIRN